MMHDSFVFVSLDTLFCFIFSKICYFLRMIYGSLCSINYTLHTSMHIFFPFFFFSSQGAPQNRPARPSLGPAGLGLTDPRPGLRPRRHDCRTGARPDRVRVPARLDRRRAGQPPRVRGQVRSSVRSSRTRGGALADVAQGHEGDPGQAQLRRSEQSPLVPHGNGGARAGRAGRGLFCGISGACSSVLGI